MTYPDYFPAKAIKGNINTSGTIPASADHSAGITRVDVEVNDQGTLVTGQSYRSGYFRYNVKSTAPGTPQAEVTGVEGVAGYYIVDGNLTTLRGGYFRTYLDTDSNPLNAVKTSIGCEMSARASYAGGTAATALAGTAFVGARIWMAPYFSAPSVGNVNNFWGLWIYGEHASQRNADAAIKISDAGGGWAALLDFVGITSGAVVEDGKASPNKMGGILVTMPSGNPGYINVYDGARA